MRIRRIATAAVTYMVAIVVALALPVSQLRTVETVQEKCCCPDPAHCHCPDHKPGSTGEPQLKSCHRVSHEVVAPQLSGFAPPQVAFLAPVVRVVALATTVPPAPHAAPSPRRPDAPS